MCVPGAAGPAVGATAERRQLHPYMAFIIAYIVDMYVYRLVYPTSYTYAPGDAGPGVGAAAERCQLRLLKVDSVVNNIYVNSILHTYA